MNLASAPATQAASEPSAGVSWPVHLEPALLEGVVDLRDWLVAAREEDPDHLLTGFAERLNALGLPIDRIATAIEALHSEYAGIGRWWTKDEGTTVRFLPHGERRDTVYMTSPFAYVNKTGEWLLLDLDARRITIIPTGSTWAKRWQPLCDAVKEHI